MSFRTRIASALGVLLVLGACAPSFRLNRYPDDLSLYQAALNQLQRKHWDNAVTGFERLTLQLAARDSLLPLSHYYLGVAHQRNGEDLLAAQSYIRLVESFPADTLSDDALFEAAHAYQNLWRKPALDPQYGFSAIQAYETLLASYPDSPRVPETERELAQLHDDLAQKDFMTAEYYFRRRAYDSAIIYYQDVMTQYPQTPTAKRAAFRMLETYGRLSYREEAAEVCRTMIERYPGDGEVMRACSGSASVAPADSTLPDTGAVPNGPASRATTR